MKLQPALLFLVTGILSLIFGFWAKGETFEVNLYDTYYVVGCLRTAVLLSLFTGFTALIYFGLEKIKRPVKLKTGFWHFVFFITGLLILVISLGPEGSANFSCALPVMLLTGILLLFISLAVFIFGLARAIFFK